MAWHVAPALDKLLAQINALAPSRSKASDGSIGDTAHQAGTSDHNPENGEVDARDFTHDPRNGADMNQIAEALRLSRDRRIRYVIWNRRQFSPKTGWAWVAYSGDNPHDKHMHVSVNDVADWDTTPWQIGAGGGEVSEKTDQIITAWSVGNPAYPGGSVEPVKWRIADEKWQKTVDGQIAAVKTAVTALQDRPATELTDEQLQAVSDRLGEVVDQRIEEVLRRVLGGLNDLPAV